MRTLFAALLLLVLPVAAHADDAENRVRMMLFSYEALPSRVAFERASPEAKRILIAIAERPDAALEKRRALSALSAWADDEVLAVYRRVLGDPKTDEATQHRVVLLVARTFKARAFGDVTPWIEHSNVQMRATAVHALAAIGGAEAQAKLRAREMRETSPVVRSAIARVLAVE